MAKQQQYGQRLNSLIILTFITTFLVKTTHSAYINHEPLYQRYGRSNDQYEVIDVSHQNNSPMQPQTGRTTRIVTNGEVNDDFWLKHLGEDFRQAIHLQVGGANQYNGLYNETAKGLPMELQNEYQASGDVPLLNSYNYPPIAAPQPIIGNIEISQQSNNATNESNVQNNNVSNTENTQNTPQGNNTEPIQNTLNNTESSTVPSTDPNTAPSTVTNTDTNTNTNQIQKTEQTFEQIYSIDNTPQYYNPNSISAYDEKHNLKYYSPKLQFNIKREDTPQKYNKNSIAKGPIVVDLPDANTNMQQEGEETPVVVKIPPVIYHDKPTAYGRQDIGDDDNEDSDYSHLKHSHTKYQQEEHTQYSQQPQQAPYPHAPYSPYTAETYNPPSYDAAGAYPPTSDAIFSENTRNMSPGGVRYLEESKTSSSQYAPSIPIEPSYSPGSSSRSESLNKNLYYEGL